MNKGKEPKTFTELSRMFQEEYGTRRIDIYSDLLQARQQLTTQKEEINRLKEIIKRKDEGLLPFAEQGKFHIRRCMGEICNNCGMNWPCDFILAKEALKLK